MENLDNVFAEVALLENNLDIGDEKIDQLLKSILGASINHSQTNLEKFSPLAKQSFVSKKLGEVVDLFNGSTPSKTNQSFWVNGNVPWFTVDDLRKQGKYITHTEKHITQLGLKESSITLVPENAVLLCCTASVGAIAISKIHLTTNQQFNALVVKDPNQLLVEYLYYWFLANMDLLKSLGRATTIDYISMSKLRELSLQIPSLQMQCELVAKLDSAFAEIESLRAQSKVKTECAKAIRDSQLSHAFTQEKAIV